MDAAAWIAAGWDPVEAHVLVGFSAIKLSTDCVHSWVL